MWYSGTSPSCGRGRFGGPMKTPSSGSAAGERTRLSRMLVQTSLGRADQDRLALLTFTRHGRDHKLVVWKLGVEDEKNLSTALPLEDVAVPRPQPWILHLLEVNTMNFCSFAACAKDKEGCSSELDGAAEILVAVPNTLASEFVSPFLLPRRLQLTEVGRSTYISSHSSHGYIPSNRARATA